MQDNAFDKGVQDKMGEFRLTPSAPVWPEVERRIRERRKRRILIFWFCLAGLLLTGAGAWWLLSEKAINHSLPVADNHNISVQLKPDTAAVARITSNQLSDSPRKIDPNTTNTTPAENATTLAGGPKDPSNGKNNFINKSHQQVKTVNPAPLKKRNLLPVNPGQEKPQVTAGNGKKSKRAIAMNKKTTIANREPEAPVYTVSTEKEKRADARELTTDTKTTVPPAAIPATETVQVITQKKVDTASLAKTDEAKPAPPVAKSKKGQHKWQTGFVLAFGEAKLTEARFSLFSEKSFDALQSGVSTGNGNFSSQSFADSLPLKGPAFHAGVFAKRKLGKKTAFSAGLNVAFYSGKQRVGVFVDSVRQLTTFFNTRTAGGFYRSGSSNWFTNRYYYLQLPLLFHWQLNKGNKLPPLEWENGLVPSWLSGSRALVYDPASAIFFQDKTVYNRFSLVYQTGLTATVARRSRHPLTAGLYYNYHFSKLQGINPPDFNHQSSYGIQFRWLLNK